MNVERERRSVFKDWFRFTRLLALHGNDVGRSSRHRQWEGRRDAAASRLAQIGLPDEAFRQHLTGRAIHFAAISSNPAVNQNLGVLVPNADKFVAGPAIAGMKGNGMKGNGLVIAAAVLLGGFLLGRR